MSESWHERLMRLGAAKDYAGLLALLRHPAPSQEEQRFRQALESIAKNTCCDRCQEAALVARAALLAQTDSGNQLLPAP